MSRRPYADWLEAKYGNLPETLLTYLRRDCNEEIDMSIYLLDNCNGILVDKVFHPRRPSGVDPAFQVAIENRPEVSTTRIILIHYSDISKLGWAYIDAIGWHFQLDLHYLLSHLQSHVGMSMKGPLPPDNKRVIMLPSENRFLTVYTHPHGYMTATTFYHDNGPVGKTVRQT